MRWHCFELIGTRRACKQPLPFFKRSLSLWQALNDPCVPGLKRTGCCAACSRAGSPGPFELFPAFKPAGKAALAARYSEKLSPAVPESGEWGPGAVPLRPREPSPSDLARVGEALKAASRPF